MSRDHTKKQPQITGTCYEAKYSWTKKKTEQSVDLQLNLAKNCSVFRWDQCQT